MMRFPAWKIVQRRPRSFDPVVCVDTLDAARGSLIAASHAYATGRLSHESYLMLRWSLIAVMFDLDKSMELVG